MAVDRLAQAALTLRAPSSPRTSASLTVAANVARQASAGHWALLPVGMRALQQLGAVVRAELHRAGAWEISLPVIQGAELWQATGRLDAYGPEMWRLASREGRQFCLGPTHEEIVTSIIGAGMSSYRDAGRIVFQIGPKFRDELRPKGGLIRAREFVMKDAYSFDADEHGMLRAYERMRDAYARIFTALEFDFELVGADAAEMGGSRSEELLVAHPEGEAQLSDGRAALELGHLFALGDRYSRPLQATVASSDDQPVALQMGCYGIGLTRVLAACSNLADDAGWRWPAAIAPWHVAVTGASESFLGQATELAAQLDRSGVRVLLDDRPGRLGGRLRDLQLIGVEQLIVLGARNGGAEIDVEQRDGQRARVNRLDLAAHLTVRAA